MFRVSINLLIFATTLILLLILPSINSAAEQKPSANSEADSSRVPPSFSKNYFNLPYIPIENGWTDIVPNLDYEVTDEKITLGNVTINTDNFKFYIGSPESINPQLSEIREFVGDEIILLTVTSSILNNDSKKSLELIDDTGKTLWSYNFTSENLKAIERISTLVNKSLGDKQNPISSLAARLDFQELIKTSTKKSEFRLCLKQSLYDFNSEICSPFYRMISPFNNAKHRYRASNLVTTITGGFNENMTPAGSIPMKNDPLIIIIKSKNQFSISLKIKAAPLLTSQWMDFFKETTNGSTQIVLVGKDFSPSEINTQKLKIIGDKEWNSQIGWLPPLEDENYKNYWFLKLENGKNKIYFPSLGGIPLTYSVDTTKVPDRSERVAIENSSFKSTYAQKLKVYGIISSDTTLSSNEKLNPTNSTIRIAKSKGNSKNTVNPQEPVKFVWDFELGRPGEDSIGNLTLTTKENLNWKTQYSVHRGWQTEFSFRIGGATPGPSHFNVSTEFAFNHWFEHMFNSSNRAWSIQRWGISLKHHSPQKSYATSSTQGQPVKLQLTTLDLKYRLTPGLWEKDESWGLVAGMESAELNAIKAQFLGVGFFWARTMPQFFDYFFNIISYFRYPKWVDLDFVYYTTPLKSSILISGANYALNFHGKILWTKRFFGEAGFGLKTYRFGDKILDKQTWYSAYYGTLGLGFNF